MPNWKIYDERYLASLTRLRPGETKLGEVIRAGKDLSSKFQFVILGIPEDIGVRANFGLGGAATAWASFLSAFLNVQSTRNCSGSTCCILGHLDCSDLVEFKFTGASVEQLRKAIHEIDQQVEQMIRKLVASGKIPIVIGGGHNNAYPIIKGTAKGLQIQGRIDDAMINVINLDAHCDFRVAEGRHSGNGFRYAFQENFLYRYAMIGLHRNYNAQVIINEMAREERINYSFWEEIFLEEKMTFKEAIYQAIHFTKSGICGLELDLDAVENILSSARSPSGISTTLARQYIHECTRELDIAYLHICEGAAQLDGKVKDPTMGKLIAYLVSDLISAFNKRKSDKTMA